MRKGSLWRFMTPAERMGAIALGIVFWPLRWTAKPYVWWKERRNRAASD